MKSTFCNSNKKIPVNNTTINKLTKKKQVDVLWIPLPISFRLSKSILAKSKFFKKN